MNTEGRAQGNEPPRVGRGVSVTVVVVLCVAAALAVSFWRRSGDVEIATATASTGDAERGKILAQRLNCYGCHVLGKEQDDYYSAHPRTGPDLRSISAKLTPEGAYSQIHDPTSVNPHSLMPHYYGLSNNSDEVSQGVGEQEVLAMVHYLFVNSTKPELLELPAGGNEGRGKELIASKGCVACHRDDPAVVSVSELATKFPTVYGGNLSTVGRRTTPAWIFSFIKAPKRFAPSTRMPDLALTDSDAADITAYLTSGSAVAASPPPPRVDDLMIDDLSFEYLAKTTYESDAIRQINSWDGNAKLYYMGFRLVRRYGCYGCHQIKGFDDARPNGADLVTWRDTRLILLSYGVGDLPKDHFQSARAKLRDPRGFETDLVFDAYDRLIMPKFALSGPEIDDLASYLVSKESQ